MKTKTWLVVGIEVALFLGILLPSTQRSAHDPPVTRAVVGVLFCLERPLIWAGFTEADLGWWVLIPRLLSTVGWGLALGYGLSRVASCLRSKRLV